MRKNSFKQSIAYGAYIAVILAAAVLMFFGGIAVCRKSRADAPTGAWQDCEQMSSIYDSIDIITSPLSAEAAMAVLDFYADEGSGTVSMGTHRFSGMPVLGALKDYIVVISLMLTSVFFFVSFINTGEDNTAEETLRKFFIWAVAVMLIFLSQRITYKVANAGSWLMETAVGTLDSEEMYARRDALKEALYEECIEDDGWTDSWKDKIKIKVHNWVTPVMYEMYLVFPVLIMLIVFLLTMGTCYGRAFQILIYGVFAPLSFIDIYETGRFGTGSGMRFIKNVFALAISGLIIIVAIALTHSVIFGLITEAVDEVSGNAGDISNAAIRQLFLSTCIVGIAEAGLVLKARSIARSIIGV